MANISLVINTKYSTTSIDFFFKLKESDICITPQNILLYNRALFRKYWMNVPTTQSVCTYYCLFNDFYY